MVLVRILVALLVIFALFLVNIVQLASLAVRPFSQSLFRKINAKCAAGWWFLLTEAARIFFKLEVKIEGNTPQELSKSALVICNHQSLMDSLALLTVGKELGVLSHFKWFAKDTLVYIPFLGWGLWFLESIFLKRNWSQDRESIQAAFKRIRQFHDPIWLVSFTEGTRKTPKKLAASSRFAESSGMKPFEHVLFPRYKGFVANIQGLDGRIEKIYDFTLVYSRKDPNFMHLFTGNPGTIHVYVEEFSIDALPRDPVQLKDWLITQFRKKDDLISSAAH